MIKHLKPKPYAKIAIPFFIACVFLFVRSIAIVQAISRSDGSNYQQLEEKREEDVSGSILETFKFDPCELSHVTCTGSSDRKISEGESNQESDENRIYDKQKGKNDSSQNLGIIAGYDITKFATLPTHEATIKAIYEAMPEIKDKFDADDYIKSKRPTSPVRGGMIERAAKKYNVDMKLILALGQNDSSFGTIGLGARTHNLCNVGNDDAGNIQNYGNRKMSESWRWELSVEGCARWLSQHKI